MKKNLLVTTLALAALTAGPALSEMRRDALGQSFASDSITVPVMANNPGLQNAVFATHVSLMNPTGRGFNVVVSLYDANGNKQEKTIALAAGELKVYENFLGTVFDFSGAGTVKFKSGGGDELFIVVAEVYTAGSDLRFGTSVPNLDFPASGAPSFSPGINVNTSQRANIGCFNETGRTNVVHATLRDGDGRQVTTFDMELAANAWGQRGVPANVNGGYVEFRPDGPADCYAVVVHNSANDGRFIQAIEYAP